jgi:hypothetical protein
VKQLEVLYGKASKVRQVRELLHDDLVS